MPTSVTRDMVMADGWTYCQWVVGNPILHSIGV